MNEIQYEKRNAQGVARRSPQQRARVADLDHPGIQGNPDNIAYFGYNDLSLDTYPKQIDVCDGKYTVIYDLDTGHAECLRYGAPWRSLVGDKMVLAMFDEIVALREEVAQLKAAQSSQKPSETPAAPPPARPRP